MQLDPGPRNRIEPSDIVQQTLLEAHRKREQFRGQGDAELAAWLRQMLTFAMADLRRDFKRAKRDIARERDLAASIEGSSCQLEALAAEEGSAGLQLLRSEMPDVAFIDVGLPGLDGYEIARRFRCESEARTADASLGCDPTRKRVLLVALTGYGQEEDRRRAEEAGFDHHLTKPVDLDALQALIACAGPRRL